MCLNCFRKSGFLIGGSDVDSDKNFLIEIQYIFVVINVNSEHINHFDDQFGTNQTHDLAISIVEDQTEDDEDNAFYEYYEEPDNLIKYHKTTIS